MDLSFSKKVLFALLTATVVLIFAHLLLKYVSIVGYDEHHGFLFELSNRFDFNDENSVPQWLSQTMFLGIALLAFLASVLDKQRDKKIVWRVIAAAGLLMSIDDASTIHEFVLQSFHNIFFTDTLPTFFRNAWMLLVPVVVFAVLWLFFSMIKSFPRRTTYIIMLAAVTFFVGTILIDSFANNIPPRSFVGQGVEGAVEGGLQMVGLSLFIYGIVDYLETYFKKPITAAVRELKS